MTLVHKTLRIQVTLLINVPQQCRQLREDISKSTVEVSATGRQEGPRPPRASPHGACVQHALQGAAEHELG